MKPLKNQLRRKYAFSDKSTSDIGIADYVEMHMIKNNNRNFKMYSCHN